MLIEWKHAPEQFCYVLSVTVRDGTGDAHADNLSFPYGDDMGISRESAFLACSRALDGAKMAWRLAGRALSVSDNAGKAVGELISIRDAARGG